MTIKEKQCKKPIEKKGEDKEKPRVATSPRKPDSDRSPDVMRVLQTDNAKRAKREKLLDWDTKEVEVKAVHPHGVLLEFTDNRVHGDPEVKKLIFIDRECGECEGPGRAEVEVGGEEIVITVHSISEGGIPKLIEFERTDANRVTIDVGDQKLGPLKPKD